MSQCTFWCSVLSDPFSGGMLPSFGFQSQCTFWCSVLSDQTETENKSPASRGSQCTFWCSVLSDRSGEDVGTHDFVGLNAPFGAQCFPTRDGGLQGRGRDLVSMHLLVLSAFRPDWRRRSRHCLTVSMHLLVLSAFRPTSPGRSWKRLLSSLNAPFGAQCFPTSHRTR